MALVGVELETLVSKTDALTTFVSTFLFIYIKLNKFGKTSQLHFKLHIQKRKHKRALLKVSLNKCDSIQISCVVFGQLQV